MSDTTCSIKFLFISNLLGWIFSLENKKKFTGIWKWRLHLYNFVFHQKLLDKLSAQVHYLDEYITKLWITCQAVYNTYHNENSAKHSNNTVCWWLDLQEYIHGELLTFCPKRLWAALWICSEFEWPNLDDHRLLQGHSAYNHLKTYWNWRSSCPNTLDKIINTYWLCVPAGIRLTHKNVNKRASIYAC